ncbi:hypothetical protein ACFYOA_23740 [Streptomyces iakyrus]|uniref:hypothetical protein n=1 Tax=Streptomyces iakyrus TaxID=68219 RepID=UPI00369976B4
MGSPARREPAGAGGSWPKWGGSGVFAAGGAVLLVTSSLPMLLSYLSSRKAPANAPLTSAGRGSRRPLLQ